jgi:murein DD-endopeptidase MepM/ murein hydrolase activator NlpD
VVELGGYAKVVFPFYAFTTNTDARVFISTEAEIADIFNDTADIFRPNGRLSYEVQVSITEPPQSETVFVELKVPNSFLKTVRSTDGIEVFVLRETVDINGTYFPIFDIEEENVEYNRTAKTVAFDLPGAAFRYNSNGLYVAVMTLSSTPGGSRTPVRRLAPPTCGHKPIFCPLSTGCDTVKSGFVRSQSYLATLLNLDHLGTEYSVEFGKDVWAAANGRIELADPDGSKSRYRKNIVLRHDDKSATRYAYLSEVKVVKGDQVTQGVTVIGKSGESKANPHFYLEYVPNGGINNRKSRIDPDLCVFDSGPVI